MKLKSVKIIFNISGKIKNGVSQKNGKGTSFGFKIIFEKSPITNIETLLNLSYLRYRLIKYLDYFSTPSNIPTNLNQQLETLKTKLNY